MLLGDISAIVSLTNSYQIQPIQLVEIPLQRGISVCLKFTYTLTKEIKIKKLNDENTNLEKREPSH